MTFLNDLGLSSCSEKPIENESSLPYLPPLCVAMLSKFPRLYGGSLKPGAPGNRSALNTDEITAKKVDLPELFSPTRMVRGRSGTLSVSQKHLTCSMRIFT